MKKLISAIYIIFFLLGYTNSQTQMHPSFSAADLDLNGIFDLTAAHGVVGMGFLSDGRLAVATWGGNRSTQTNGKVVVLSNVLDDNTAITADEIVSDLTDPVGMTVVNDVLYISDKTGIVKMNPDGTGRELFTAVNFTGNYHEYHFSITYKDGFLYSALGQDWPVKDVDERGGFMKTDINTGVREFIAGGFRESNGVGIGTGYEIFVTDNQGHWLPTSKMVHVEEGDYFGFSNALMPFNKPVGEQKPPVVWLDHNAISQSPFQPVLIDRGEFQGQMFLGEMTKCKILRVYAERVNNVWQGAVFQFAGVDGLSTPPNRQVWGPDGNLYLGGMQGGNGWGSQCGNTGSITKLTPTGTVAFDILAVRILANGFEIEYTKPAGSSASQVNNYQVERWGYQPASGYGAGNKQNVQNINPTSVNLSADGLRATVQFSNANLQHGNGLFPSTLFHFTLQNIQSRTNEALWTNQAWYTMNESGPADVLGCTTIGDPLYSAAAEYNDGFQCQNNLGINKASNRKLDYRISDGVLTVSGVLDHTIIISDLSGRLIKKEKGIGDISYPLSGLLKSGIYFLKISSSAGSISQKLLIQ